jgi:transketolase
MRNSFAKEITLLADEDERIVLLSGDIGNRLFDEFKARHPDRFYNCGVAEANMIGVAAGLAMSGLRPVCYTIAPFLTYRCMEQIRVDLCYHRAPVTLVGTGAGLAYASLGATHHSCEEVGMLRLLPGLTVMAPADEVEVRGCLRAALRDSKPAYLRIGKKGEPVVHARPLEIRVGRALTVRRGGDVCLLSCGVLLPAVLAAADLLAAQGVSAEVLSFPTVKPLDEATLRRVFADFPLVGTVEEHSVLGGFGGSVAEWACASGASSARLIRFGTPDEFLHETCEQEEARARLHLTAGAIAERMMAATPQRL